MGLDCGSGWLNIWGMKCIDSKYVKLLKNIIWIVWCSIGLLKLFIIWIYNVFFLRKKVYIILFELDVIKIVILLIGFCWILKFKNLFNDNIFEMEESFIENYMVFVKFLILGLFI